MLESARQVDVAIMGGGLAGLTLALQLRQANPELSIEVLERARLPHPHATHKVGESTVEIGSHYLAHTLGLQTLLEDTQLRKFGLRFFLGAGQHGDLALADELGASNFLPAVSYQIDRGRLENDLTQQLINQGVTVSTGTRVADFELGGRAQRHEFKVVNDDGAYSLSCRWAIDAAARPRLFQRKLNKQQDSDHQMCAAWFRLDDVIDVENWTDSAAWLNRCNNIPRRLSTNHLLGPGYWCWIIPLVNDRVSLGLVTDPTIHAPETYDSFEKMQAWMQHHQPLLANNLNQAEDKLMDFRYLKKLSHGCQQNFSNDRWAISGEAGVFSDPFYSPGTDFIAICNTYITDLICRGQDDPMHGIRCAVYEKMYRSFYESTLSLYQQQYPGFGDTRLMVLKATWDYAYYWSVLAWLFYRDVLTDIAFLRNAESTLKDIQELNFRMQAEFRQRAALKIQSPGKGRFFDQRAIPVLLQLNGALLEPSDKPLSELESNGQRLVQLAPLIKTMLQENSDTAGNASSIERKLLGDLRERFATPWH